MLISEERHTEPNRTELNRTVGVWWGCAGGRYSEGNLKKSMTMLNGAPHAVMLKADFDQAVKSLNTSLATHSPFGIHGLTISAHPLTPHDIAAPEGTGAVLKMEFHRTPFGETVEYSHPTSVLMSHITAAANGETVAEALPTMAGFERACGWCVQRRPAGCHVD